MASADLRQELDCSICLSIYTDPVTLRCGHNFCRVCIDRVLDTQEGSGVYTCPECREEYQQRPVLEKTRKLCNIVEHVCSITEVYGVQSPVHALKSCQTCEASLCGIHCETHNPSPEHVLSDSTTLLGNRKCSVHKKILEYYCTEDAACICVSCCLIGEHRGHQVESLDEASEKKKEKLRNVLQKLTTKRAEAEKRVQSLQERRREDQGKAAGVTETVTALFRDIRRQLEDLEKRVLSEISGWEQRVSLSVSDLIQQLEIKKDELSRKMCHFEELCNMPDPVTVLQESDTGDLCDSEDTERHDNQVHGAGDLDEVLISETLQTLSDMIAGIDTTAYVQNATDIFQDITTAGNTDTDIITGINIGMYAQEATDLFLDVTTASNYIHISEDMKTASWALNQDRPVTAERFQITQVISTRGFSSGRHYWEVDISESGVNRVGMCYPSIGRRGWQSHIGNNDKSWCLCIGHNQDSARHDNNESGLPYNILYDRVRVYLDYEAGQLFFYSVADQIRYLHTYTATFTEPLHAALWVGDGSITISGGVRSWETLP